MKINTNFITFVLEKQNILVMKSYLVAFFLVFTLFVSIRGNSQWIYGGGMKYNTNTEIKAIALNAKVGKDISEKFDANVDFAYYLSKKVTWSIDLDIHYKLVNISDKLIVNPVAGLNFTKTEVINNSLGVGLSFRVPDDRYTYYFEPKWILDNSQFVFNVGVFF